jgi:uncharacterized protein (TIGR00255 family)
MLRGMTAYAKAQKKSNEAELVVDIQSVNRKSLDIVVRLPGEYSCFEPAIRKLISEYALRGYITCTVQIAPLSDSAYKVEVNIPYAKSLFASAVLLAQSLEVPSLEVPSLDYNAIFSFLLKEKGVFHVTATVASFEQQVLDAVKEACVEFAKVKEREGSGLAVEIQERLERIEELRNQIETASSGASQKYKERLLRLISDIQCDIEQDDRLLKECAIVAEKLDISEELSRLQAHIHHMKDALATNGCGKTLEFILQEMQREANTAASKSQSAEISKLVILAKSEIEKIREQVQNVE